MTKSKGTERLIAKLQLLITKLHKFKDFLNSVEVTSRDELVWEQLEMRLEQIKPIAKEYLELLVSLEAPTTEENILSYDVFEEEYFLLTSRASLILKNKHKSISNSPISSDSLSSASTSQINTNIKLPVLNISSFSGHYAEWTSFYETFTSLIDNNSNLSEVEKFYYLQNSLKGPAKEVIHELTATSGNYKIAMHMLNDRFNNEKLIIFSHLEAIFEYTKLTKESAPELRKFQNNLTRHLRALDNYKITDDKFKAAVLSYIIKSKVDLTTATAYSKFKLKHIPSLEESISFLSSRCEILEDIAPNNFKNTSNSLKSMKPNTKYHASNFTKQAFAVTGNYSCAVCKENHLLYSCPTFLAFPIQKRIDKTNELRVCKNCLKHSSNFKCNSKHKCKNCQKPHNSLLCFSNSEEGTSRQLNFQDAPDPSASKDIASANVSSSVEQISLSCSDYAQVLLSTAIIKIRSIDNKWLTAKCLLDSGSQVNFITDNMCRKLGCKPLSTNTSVVGINCNTSSLNKSVNIQIASLHNEYKSDLSCLVIPKITQNLPISSFDKSSLNIPTNIKLADSNFNKSSPVDILIGATHFYHLLCIGQISIGPNKPILQKTLLGWIISGNLSKRIYKSDLEVCSNFALEQPPELSSDQSLQDSISQFWHVENIQPQHKISLLSPEERFCENHFAQTVKQNENGTLVVSIPFNSKLSLIGESKERALERFYYLERRFSKDFAFHQEYSKFINEYIQLGHATLVETYTVPNNTITDTISTFSGEMSLQNLPNFYLPHHAVFKTNSLTTKIRVVFDGSAKSTSNISINDAQIVGPVLQDDLFSILLRFRQHKIALTGDCEKMYRMIQIDPSLRKFQSILWRDNPDQPISTYQLNTITYGTASASYLATKCLEYLADQNQEQFPKTSQIIKSSFYMDDLLFTADTVDEILQAKQELVQILGSANIPIRKFLSNNAAVIEESDNSNTSLFNIPLGERSNAKALGLSWNSVSDYIYYSVQLHNNGPSITKRSILSTVSQLFDPLGLLSPVLINGKIIIQRLWELKISWDESIPSALNSEWLNFREQLSYLASLQIPRCVTPIPECKIQLHGFSDSSSVAYGACIYVRCSDSNNKISTHLLCSKSRVAPLHTVTIPRLELCSAVLLAQLMCKVQTAWKVNPNSIFLWSDSTIVLSWLQSAPNKYKTFVANRIATIQEIFPNNFWHHVKSEENPADLISRGITTSEILTNSLWWNGPNFLSTPIEVWKNFNSTVASNNDLEMKSSSLVVTNDENSNEILALFKKFSSFTKLQRVLAYVLRFIANCRKPDQRYKNVPLTVSELQTSLHTLVKLCQQYSFSREIESLSSGQPLKSNSKVLSLNPFLDENQLLRVGGRIGNSQFQYSKRHPLLLPKGHPLTELLIKQYHYNLLHCGAQQLLSCMRERFWPIAGRTATKKIIRSCIKCFRVNPVSYNPLMGSLPIKRVQPNTPAFYNTGLDYAGPIFIKNKKGKGSKLIKSYICLFVCLVTRAVHLELVTDLCADSFIAVLKRFVARRGKPFSISSDNAKNFIGANNQLKELYKSLQSLEFQNKITNHLSNQSIKWEFIIPRAPHQGGMWEAGIKATKLHLKKILANSHLTYEDFCTVLTQIEGVLNSRPLSYLSTDPTDLTPLTPGHFLIGRPLCALPEPSYLQTKENRLSLYQRAQRLMQDFWKRWSIEVVPDLQRRTKWFANLPNLKSGAVVLIRDDNRPPLTWLLGRITEVHQAADGVVRSCTVQIPGGHLIKRPVNKLCALPL